MTPGVCVCVEYERLNPQSICRTSHMHRLKRDRLKRGTLSQSVHSGFLLWSMSWNNISDWTQNLFMLLQQDTTQVVAVSISTDEGRLGGIEVRQCRSCSEHLLHFGERSGLFWSPRSVTFTSRWFRGQKTDDRCGKYLPG